MDLHTLQITIAHAKSRSVLALTSHCLLTAPNTGGSSASVLMSLPAAYCFTTNSWLNWFRVKVMLLPVVSQPVCLGIKPHLGPKVRFLLLSDSWGYVVVGTLSDERASLSFTIADSSLQHSYSWGPIPVGLMTMFYSLRLETPPNLDGQVPIFISPRNSYTPRHLAPFLSSPTTHRAVVEVFEPAFTWEALIQLVG
jgi:hypothetical protein